jgi:hypothetical protein
LNTGFDLMAIQTRQGAILAELTAIRQWNEHFPVNESTGKLVKPGWVARQMREKELRAELRELANNN